MIAHNPLHGSGQAGFPHPALALGNDAHTAQGIGMTDGRQRQPTSDHDELRHPFVRNSTEEAFDVQVEHPVHSHSYDFCIHYTSPV